MGVESWNNPKFQPQSFPTPVGHNRRWNLTALDPYLSYKWSVCLWVQKLICPIFQASLHNSKGSRGANGGVNEKRRFTYCLRDLLGKQYKSSCSLSHKFPYFLQKSLLMKTWVYQLPCLQLLSMCLHYMYTPLKCTIADLWLYIVCLVWSDRGALDWYLWLCSTSSF